MPRRTLLLALLTLVVAVLAVPSAWAGTAEVKDGTLTYTAGDEVNDVTITESVDPVLMAPSLLVSDAQSVVAAATGCLPVAPNTARCDAAATQIVVTLGDGADAVDLQEVGTRSGVLDGGLGVDVIRGAGGNDRVRSRDATADTIFCEDGDDAVLIDAVDTVGPDCEFVDRSAPTTPLDPPPAASVGDARSAEGEPAGFAVRLSSPAPAGGSRVRYTTVDGSAGAPDDYRAVAGMVQFAAGETEKLVTASTIEDGADEPDEGFELQLNPTTAEGLTVADGSGAAVIADDDDPIVPFASRIRPRLAVAFAPARDRKGPFRYIISGSVTGGGDAGREACAKGGRIVVRVLRRDSRLVATRTTTLSDRCTYQVKLRFKRRKPLGNGRLRVRVSYDGNALLEPVRAKQRAIRAG